MDEALQIHGGLGVMEDGPIARSHRDAEILTVVGEGTSQVLRRIIARNRADGPLACILGVIRWFQLQPTSSVGLNTGRPESLREDTSKIPQ